MLKLDLYKCENPTVLVGRVPVSGVPMEWNEGKHKHFGYYGMYARTPIVVPCGKCRACQMRKQREWQSRISREMIRGNNNGFRTFFVTLTLDQNICDKYYHFDPAQAGTNDGKKFYREVISKRLLDNLRADRGANLKFRYFCVCEFGSEYQRLHYHFVFIVENPNAISPRSTGRYYVRDNKNNCQRLQTPIERGFADIIEKYWRVRINEKYSDISFYKRVCTSSRTGKKFYLDTLTDKNSLPIGNVEKVQECDLGTCQYVTKYVNKSFDDIARGQCPFHRQSQGLGYLDLVYCINMVKKGNIDYIKYLRTYLNNLKLPINSKNDMKINSYYTKILRKLTDTYLSHNLEFCKKSIPIALRSLNALKLVVKDKEYNSLEDISVFENIPLMDKNLKCVGFVQSDMDNNKIFMELLDCLKINDFLCMSEPLYIGSVVSDGVHLFGRNGAQRYLTNFNTTVAYEN